MIEISEQKIDGHNHEVFTILNDGFHPKGYVQMECRLSDMDSEGEAFFIEVFDENVSKNGKYAPISMDKSELKQFIDYLKRMHDLMPSTGKSIHSEVLTKEEFYKLIKWSTCPSDCKGGQHVSRNCTYVIGEIYDYGLKVKFNGYRSWIKNREVITDTMYDLYLKHYIPKL